MSQMLCMCSKPAYRLVAVLLVINVCGLYINNCSNALLLRDAWYLQGIRRVNSDSHSLLDGASCRSLRLLVMKHPGESNNLEYLPDWRNRCKEKREHADRGIRSISRKAARAPCSWVPPRRTCRQRSRWGEPGLCKERTIVRIITRGLWCTWFKGTCMCNSQLHLGVQEKTSQGFLCWLPPKKCLFSE